MRSDHEQSHIFAGGGIPDPGWGYSGPWGQCASSGAHGNGTGTGASEEKKSKAGKDLTFMPVKGLVISDLIDANDYFIRVEDPFTKEPVTVVRAIRPDVAVLHVQEADEDGNARITGPLFEDVLFSRAAKRVILTTENIVHGSVFKGSQKKADIPRFLVEAVVKVPKGASPCSCPGLYDIDGKNLKEFKGLKDMDGLYAYLKAFEKSDYKG